MTGKFVINWRHKLSGKRGFGRTPYDKVTAQAIIADLNDLYPHIEHTIEAHGQNQGKPSRSAGLAKG